MAAFIITTSPVTSLFVSPLHSSRNCNLCKIIGTRVNKRQSIPPARHVMRMGLGEDGLNEDLTTAQNMIQKGSTVEEAKEMMTKLEYRRAILAREVTNIEDTIDSLTKSIHQNDKNVLEQTMEAALNMFKPNDDNYPSTGTPSGYSMDKPNK